MADDVERSESNSRCRVIGSITYHPRGRRARHAKKAKVVNVGDPKHPHKEGVLANKYKSEEAKKMFRKSDEA